MKRFIQRALSFAALVILLVGGICASEIAAELSFYHDELKMPEGAEALVCNDSQTGAAVDPAEWSGVYNFSAHGRALDQAYLTALDAMERNGGRLKVIVFDVTPVGAVDSMGGTLRHMGYSSKYWLVHYLHRDENTRDLSGGLAVARDNLVGRRLRHFWRAIRGQLQFRSSLYGEFVTTDIVDKELLPERYWGLLKGKAASVRGLGEVGARSPFVSSVLDPLKAAADANGVRLVLMTTPWNEDLRNACGKESLDHFTRVMQDYSRQKGCPYLDYLRMDLDASEWGDGNHLNSKGARKFTRALYADLKARGLVK